MYIFSNQSKKDFGGECPNWLRHYIHGKFVVKTPLGAQPGFGTQPHNEATGDLWVEISNKSAVINIELVRLPNGQ